MQNGVPELPPYERTRSGGVSVESGVRFIGEIIEITGPRSGSRPA